VLTITNNSKLYLDLKNYNVTVKQGAGILVKHGSTLLQGTPETALLSTEEESQSPPVKGDLGGLQAQSVSEPTTALLSTNTLTPLSIAYNGEGITPLEFTSPSSQSRVLGIADSESEVITEEKYLGSTPQQETLFDDKARTLENFLAHFQETNQMAGKTINQKTAIFKTIPESILVVNTQEETEEPTPTETPIQDSTSNTQHSVPIPKSIPESVIVLPNPQNITVLSTEFNDPLPTLDPPNSAVFHTTDHLGSTSLDSDNEGNIVSLVGYFSFGEIKVEENLITNYKNPYKYTGKELDGESGLYYYEARYYDPELKRFTSIDPWFGNIKDPQSLNKYSYVQNNPLILIDPTGESAAKVSVEGCVILCLKLDVYEDTSGDISATVGIGAGVSVYVSGSAGMTTGEPPKNGTSMEQFYGAEGAIIGKVGGGVKHQVSWDDGTSSTSTVVSTPGTSLEVSTDGNVSTAISGGFGFKSLQMTVDSSFGNENSIQPNNISSESSPNFL